MSWFHSYRWKGIARLGSLYLLFLASSEGPKGAQKEPKSIPNPLVRLCCAQDSVFQDFDPPWELIPIVFDSNWRSQGTHNRLKINAGCC